MARLIHVSASLVASGAAPAQTSETLGSGVRASRPRAFDIVTPAFALTPAQPILDSRVSPDVGVSVIAQLSLFGAMVGAGRPLPAANEVDGSGAEAILGGNPSPAGAPPPPAASAFARGCAAGLSLFAQGVGLGDQCLLLFGLHGCGPREDAVVQVFAGLTQVGNAEVRGDDQLPVLVDLPSGAATVSVEIWLRLCGEPDDAALGVRGVAGFLL